MRPGSKAFLPFIPYLPQLLICPAKGPAIMTRKSRKFGSLFSSKNKKNQVQRSRQQKLDTGLLYQPLEPRQMMDTTLGLNLTGHTFQTHSFAKDPNMVGDIGTTHYAEAINDKISFFNRENGTRDIYKTQKQFWIDAGANVSSTSINNAQIVFDRFANRWLILGEGSETQGNWLYLAISKTANPNDGFRATRFVGDSTGIRHNGELSIGVDEDALLIASRNLVNVAGFPQNQKISNSIYTIPRTDLYSASPTLTNMSRFENLSLTTHGDYIRPASSIEQSDNKATFISSGAVATNGSSTGENYIINVSNVKQFGATMAAPVKVDFDPSVDFTWDFNFGGGATAPLARQPHPNDIFINAYSPQVVNNVVDIRGSLWFAHTIRLEWISGDVSVAVAWYEVNKDRNELMQGGVITMPSTVLFPNAFEWDVYNPSIAVNKHGIVTINYTVSSQEYEVTPSAATSIGITVNGKAIYDPIFDVIGYNHDWPDRPGRNTQFELVYNFPDDDLPEPTPDDDPNLDRDDFIQEGLSLYVNNGGNPSTFSSRSAGNFDPLNINRFWVSSQWANVESRWSTQITEIVPNKMRPVITGDELDNVFVFRRYAADISLLEVEIDGKVTDLLPYEVLGNVVINGFDGADRFILDYSNGDPEPSGGFTFNGMRESDTVETNDPDGAQFLVDGRWVNAGPAWLAYAQELNGDGSGTYNNLTSFMNIEELIGGPGNDYFTVTDYVDTRFNPPSLYNGYLPGSMRGNEGDDTFEFGSAIALFPNSIGGRIGDSIYGDEGFNTMSFKTRSAETTATLLGKTLTGYEGRANDPDGPIGDSQVFDRFNEIDYIRGSDFAFDRIVGLNLETYVYVDDEDSYYQTGDTTLGFFQVNSIDCSNFVDTFEGVRNSVNPLQLNGRNGNDVYYFSSDGMGLNGSTADLKDVLFAQGGAGVNELYISNRGGPAAGTEASPALILNNRVAGMGEIAYNSIGGSFNVHIWASNFADRIDLHSFLPGNTLELYLLGGNDAIDIEDLSKAFVDVYGGDGDDLYIIQKVQGVDFRNLVLHDSVGSERDRVSLRGTVLNETFLVNNTTFVDTNVVYTGIETFGLLGRGGDDTFNIESFDFELFIDGEDGNDVFNYSSDAPLNSGNLDAIIGKMTVDGGSGVNQLRISDQTGAPKTVTMTDSTITGLFAQPFTYLSTGGTFNASGNVGGITITGSDNGGDSYTINGLNVDDTLRIFGRTGNDTFFIAANARGNIQLEGGSGNDAYGVEFVGSGSREVKVIDSTTSDTLNVFGTNLVDVIIVNSTGVTRGTESVRIQANLSQMQVFGRDGNDKLTVNGGTAATLRVAGDNNDDEITVNGTTGIGNIEVQGNNGNDTFFFQTIASSTTPLGLGGSGNDIFNVGISTVPNIRIDGQTGDDRYNITFRSTGTRQVDARDTGVGGNDVVNAMATSAADTVTLQTNRVELATQAVLFDVATERLVVNLKEGDDTLDIYGSVAGSTLTQGDIGNDKIVIHSTTSSPTMTADGGVGNDILVVKSTLATTRTTLYGKEGDDRFNIGSTLEENVGNLNLIRGRVAAIGGVNADGGQDRLYINDIIGNDAYAYNLGPTYVRSLPGPNNILRPNFAGITFDATMEHVRLDGTLQPNFFSIEASPNTEFYLYGNLPSPGTSNGDQVYLRAKPNDGYVIRFTDRARGRGYISFTNGDQFIRFDNIEQTWPLAPTNMPPAPSDYSWGGPSKMQPAGGMTPLKMSGRTFDQLAGSVRLGEDDGIVNFGGSSQVKSSNSKLDVNALDNAFAKL
jgi:hypothetical protein